jgi:hypothetical protein
MSKSRADLLHGTLDHLILRTLSLGSMHGWAIAKHIGQVSEDVLHAHQSRGEAPGGGGSGMEGVLSRGRSGSGFHVGADGGRDHAPSRQDLPPVAGAV